MALNVDGSAQLNPVVDAYGGLIRGSNGNFLQGFHGSLGHYYYERWLCAILHGLFMYWEMGYKKIYAILIL